MITFSTKSVKVPYVGYYASKSVILYVRTACIDRFLVSSHFAPTLVKEVKTYMNSIYSSLNIHNPV